MLVCMYVYNECRLCCVGKNVMRATQVHVNIATWGRLISRTLMMQKSPQPSMTSSGSSSAIASPALYSNAGLFVCYIQYIS